MKHLYSTSFRSVYDGQQGNIFLSGQSGASGMYIMTRTGENTIELYRNGSSLGSDTDASGSFSSFDNTILRHNTEYFSGTVAIYFVMDGVTDNEAAGLNSIFEIYMDHLGVGVQ